MNKTDETVWDKWRDVALLQIFMGIQKKKEMLLFVLEKSLKISANAWERRGNSEFSDHLNAKPVLGTLN